MATTTKDPRQRAEAAFRKEEAAREGAKAWLEYQAAGAATRQKTEKLKALRLAKETKETAEAKKQVKVIKE